MAEIFNLNRVRKQRAKAETKAQAAANRVAHGRTRIDRDAADKARIRVERELDGRKLED